MTVKRLLNKLSKAQQDYYTFLAKECFSAFTNAEDNFKIYRYASCNAWLFHSSEFFWKALTVLSGKYFDLSHEASQADMAKISNDLLSDNDKIRAYDILSKFPKNRRDLARYGYYEKGTVTRSPIEIFNRTDTENNLNEIGWLVDRLREIHYYQIFEPAIKIGILSGYILARKEKPCSYYPHSQYRKKPAQWMLDLNNIVYDAQSKLLQTSLTSISNLNSGAFSIVINPFGEAYPELGNAEGVGFKTILSYIRDGGIFVNSGGQPFVYSWDVNTGSCQLLVSFIPALSNIESGKVEGIPKLSIKTSLAIPHETLLLKRYFNVETEWDSPEKYMVGPKEVDIQFDDLLGRDDDKPITKAKVYRPAKGFSHSIIPLAHCSDKSLWDDIYPVVAVKFGRGFLIHIGMSLDEEREYKIVLEIIRRLGLVGYEMLAKSYPSSFLKQSN
jgi:hypothetical protein